MGQIRSTVIAEESGLAFCGFWFRWRLAMKPMDGVLAHPLLGFDGEEKGGRGLPDSITCAGGESLSE